MDSTKVFQLSTQMVEELKKEIINSTVIDGGLRLELVEQCIYISFDHGLGVTGLLAIGLPTQAMVLFRAQFEAVVRAYWLLFIASNHQVSKLNFSYTFDEQFTSDTCPMIGEMLEKLSNADLPAKSVIDHLCDFKKYHLKQLNSLVHTGKQSFTRDVMGYDPSMILNLMRQSNNLVTVAAQIMLKHTIPDKQKFIHYLIEKYRPCFYLDEDVDPSMKARVEGYFK
ncbi:hypothetical protein [Acinetobacter sp. A3]|uniref:DUF6988 family protein n=1 Tax=Acinetobacter sp. A3 TaxID=2725492 RepID=UPI001445C99A|nr:hypothetical protein [Acinetobacter sp. A3]